MLNTSFLGSLHLSYLSAVRPSATKYQVMGLFQQGITTRQFNLTFARSVGTVATTPYNRHIMKRWKKDKDLKVHPLKTTPKTNGLKGQLKVCDLVAS